jgi:hypothetical protein
MLIGFVFCKQNIFVVYFKDTNGHFIEKEISKIVLKVFSAIPNNIFFLIFLSTNTGNETCEYLISINVIQCKPLNVITLGQCQTDNINQMISLSELNKELKSILPVSLNSACRLIISKLNSLI